MNRVYQNYVTSHDGSQIYFMSLGTGLPFVMCDGIGCDKYVWKYSVSYFQDSCRIVRWNYRGHGKSPLPTDMHNLSIQDCCKDLKAVLDDDEIDKAVFIGHSMGVQVILEFYRMYPDRVLALIPLCGSYGHPLKTFHDNSVLDMTFPLIYMMINAFPRVFEAVFKKLLPTEFAWQVAIHSEINGHLLKQEDFMPYFDHLSRISLPLFVKMLDYASKHTCEDLLPKIKVPTLIIAGEFDTFTPMWLSEKMHRQIPNSEILVVPHGSHTAPIEMPYLVNLRIEKFFIDKLGFKGVNHFAQGADPVILASQVA